MINILETEHYRTPLTILDKCDNNPFTNALLPIVKLSIDETIQHGKEAGYSEVITELGYFPCL